MTARSSLLHVEPTDDERPSRTGSPVELGGRDDLRALRVRRDGPALGRLALQLALFAASASLTVSLAAAGHPGWIAAVLVCGCVLATLFPPLHESGHQTAFATPWLNESTVWICAAAMLQAPSFFRAFHWQHHRETQNPETDPEISGAPGLLDDWPGNPFTYALLVSGQSLLFGKLAFTLGCGLLPRKLWNPVFPFINDRNAGRIVWESRAVALLLVGGTLVGLATVPGFAKLLLAWPVAHVVLGFYLMAEHTGLGHDGSQEARTRTVVSNAFLRWWMWNMPYHAEHHAHPGVPFHQLPALHARMRDALPHVSPGYAAFHREALMRALGRIPR